jgi:hypothetical protein
MDNEKNTLFRYFINIKWFDSEVCHLWSYFPILLLITFPFIHEITLVVVLLMLAIETIQIGNSFLAVFSTFKIKTLETARNILKGQIIWQKNYF